jgi:hypothetical protein
LALRNFDRDHHSRLRFQTFSSIFSSHSRTIIEKLNFILLALEDSTTSKLSNPSKAAHQMQGLQSFWLKSAWKYPILQAQLAFEQLASVRPQ